LLLASGKLVRVPLQHLRRGVEVDLPHDLGDTVTDVADGLCMNL
jgi:hypothetical protein